MTSIASALRRGGGVCAATLGLLSGCHPPRPAPAEEPVAEYPGDPDASLRALDPPAPGEGQVFLDVPPLGGESDGFAHDFEPKVTRGPSQPEGHGRVESAAVGALLESNAARFRACNIHGSALVRLQVDEAGTVTWARYDRESLRDGDKECPLAVLRALRFPRPTGGDAVVLVPLVFRGK